MSFPLYRLKSNPTTIVEKRDGYSHIVWTDHMEKYEVDSRWMIHKFNKDNSIPLTGLETRNIRKKIKKFAAPSDSSLSSKIPRK